MISKDFNEIVERQVFTCMNTLVKKADEYATEDRLHNFKTAAALQECTSAQALAGMMAKHTVSVYDMIEGDVFDPALWEEKITDHINYLLLLKAVLMEEWVDKVEEETDFVTD